MSQSVCVSTCFDVSFHNKSRINVSLLLVNSIIVILGQGDAEWWVYCANSKWKIHIQTSGYWIPLPRRARTSVVMYICFPPVMILGMLCYISCDLFWTWAIDFLQTHPGQVLKVLCLKKFRTLPSVLNGIITVFITWFGIGRNLTGQVKIYCCSLWFHGNCI